jgi:hypothetical protein
MIIDTVTVVFRDELDMLQAQASSLARYWHADGIINVIVNDNKDIIKEIDKAWWGPLKDRVRIDCRGPVMEHSQLSGWVTQQMLKLACCANSQATWSMVLDAKTVFVRDFNPEDYFDEFGRVMTVHLPIQPVFEPSRKIINELFDIEMTRVAGPGGVPHWIHSESTRELLQYVEEKTGRRLYEFWQDNGMLTEFMLHSGYIQHRYGSLNHFYSDLQYFSVINISHDEVDQFDRKFLLMEDPPTLAVSIHRNAKLTNGQWTKFEDFLRRRGVLSYARRS